MGIAFDKISQTWSLHTADTSYQMQIGPLGYLLHLYYGRRVEESTAYLHLPRDCGFSPNPYELQAERSWSLDTMPQEYSGSNCGDYRLSSIRLETADGISGADLRVKSWEICRGKYALDGLPSSFGAEDEAETLSVILQDEAASVEAELLYGVFPGQNVITRAVRITNCGSAPLYLEKAASACLDLPFGDWELLHFHGRHAMERQTERLPVGNTTLSIGSRRGASSHQHNPFLILCEPSATEDAGECYAAMLAYSGGFRMDVEKDQSGSVRLVAGIQDEGFRWKLEPGAQFVCPELILSYTHRGLTALSHDLHRFIRKHVCRGIYASGPRPVLLNTWEAAYFDFDEEKILRIARDAKDLGVELLVLDDGWFGRRDDDRTSLGDWKEDLRKLPGGLERLVDKLHAMGLQAGLWLEPEMVSEDSDLFRSHPDWALIMPGRKPSIGRSQLVLDMSRPEVIDYLSDLLSSLLRRSGIDYVKWDMNRNMTDLYSAELPPDRQGEIAHRYILGVYTLLDRLTREFPRVLFEGCAGGGGRFDAGMLAYCPQIWCSDNTDPIARLNIQYGTSFGYPPATMGAHVSASPNHQTGRTTPLGTRFCVALAGAFGYELDPGKLSRKEREAIQLQIRDYHRWQKLLAQGDYLRLTDDQSRFVAWENLSGDRSECLVSLVMRNAEANPRPLHLRLKGLDPKAIYILEEQQISSGSEYPVMKQRSFTGAALMYAGITLPALLGDYPSALLYFKRQERA